jgi:hypothetical protein
MDPGSLLQAPLLRGFQEGTPSAQGQRAGMGDTPGPDDIAEEPAVAPISHLGEEHSV